MAKIKKPLTFAPPQGQPPEIEWVNIADLQVDDNYQRSLTAMGSTPLIESIAQNWDWRLCAPLTIARRGTLEMFVIDGQHRLGAARLRGDIKRLPGLISSFGSVEDEARLFVSVNTARKKLTGLETFRARIAAGDPTSRTVLQLITDAGLSVAHHTNCSHWKPGAIGSISGIQTAIARYGRPVVSAALVNLAEAFPDEVLRYAGRILQGLYLVYAKPPEDFDPDRFFDALLTKSQEDWFRAAISNAAAYGDKADEAMHRAMVEAYARQPERAEAPE